MSVLANSIHCLLFSVLLGGLCQSAWAQQRYALVIGNSAYENFRTLRNPDDATDMGELLKSKDFDVSVLININERKMKSAIADFTAK